MNALLDLGPREAGVDEVEVEVGFADGVLTPQAHTRCTGCCVNGTAVEFLTHSVTQ